MMTCFASCAKLLNLLGAIRPLVPLTNVLIGALAPKMPYDFMGLSKYFKNYISILR